MSINIMDRDKKISNITQFSIEEIKALIEEGELDENSAYETFIELMHKRDLNFFKPLSRKEAHALAVDAVTAIDKALAIKFQTSETLSTPETYFKTFIEHLNQMFWLLQTRGYSFDEVYSTEEDMPEVAKLMTMDAYHVLYDINYSEAYERVRKYLADRNGVLVDAISDERCTNYINFLTEFGTYSTTSTPKRLEDDIEYLMPDTNEARDAFVEKYQNIALNYLGDNTSKSRNG